MFVIVAAAFGLKLGCEYFEWQVKAGSGNSSLFYITGPTIQLANIASILAADGCAI